VRLTELQMLLVLPIKTAPTYIPKFSSGTSGGRKLKGNRTTQVHLESGSQKRDGWLGR